MKMFDLYKENDAQWNEFNLNRNCLDEKIRKAEDQKKKLDRRIKRLEVKRQNLDSPSWIKNLIEPIASSLVEGYYPDYQYEIYGPFGICREVSVHFKKPIGDGDPFGITFIPTGYWGDGNFKLKIRDIRSNTHAFPAGSIAEMNGMNHPSIDIPEDADTAWFYGHLR